MHQWCMQSDGIPQATNKGASQVVCHPSFQHLPNIRTIIGHYISYAVSVFSLYLCCCCFPLQRLVEQFESLMLSAGPGAPEADISSFPRPTGNERAAAHAPQQPYDTANCSPDNMRPTVMGVPNSTALRLRWAWRQQGALRVVCARLDQFSLWTGKGHSSF